MFGGDQIATYTYNTLDNLKRAKVPGRDTYYCYDAKNRLDFLRTGSNCSASPTHTYLAYDDQGNLESKDAALGVDLDFDFDTGNRLREVMSDGVALERYRYDAHGRRTLASRISGPADSLGVIFSQYSNSGPLMYQENQRPGVNKAIDYIYLAGSLIAQREESLATGAVTVKYQHTDALGSPVAVTSDAGGLLERVDYEPYGKVLGTAVAKDGPGYTGHVLDAATGMNYMQQRYYDPEIGRFLSADPVTADGSTGANFNRYWYANNNPYRFSDPDGRQAELNAFDPSQEKALYNGAQAYNSPKGVFTIAAHADPFGVGAAEIVGKFPGHERGAYTPAEVWDLIKDDYEAGGYTSIRIAACGSSNPDAYGISFIGELSRLSGQAVEGTRSFVSFANGQANLGDGVQRSDGSWAAVPIKGASWDKAKNGKEVSKGIDREIKVVRIDGRIDSMRNAREDLVKK